MRKARHKAKAKALSCSPGLQDMVRVLGKHQVQRRGAGSLGGSLVKRIRS
jgi:hypothetical protein